MGFSESLETTYPTDTLFEFGIGCLGCAQEVTVLFEDLGSFSKVEELSRASGAPIGFSVKNSVNAYGGASSGSCQLRDTALPPDMRSSRECPNAERIAKMTEEMEEIGELIIEKGTK